MQKNKFEAKTNIFQHLFCIWQIIYNKNLWVDVYLEFTNMYKWNVNDKYFLLG